MEFSLKSWMFLLSVSWNPVTRGSRCQSYLECFTWRHDSILSFMLYALSFTWFYFKVRYIERKKNKYTHLIKDLEQNEDFVSVKLVNLSISSLGAFDKECSIFLKMLESIGLDKRYQQYCIKKITAYSIERHTIFSAAETKSGQTLNCWTFNINIYNRVFKFPFILHCK